MAGSYLMDTSLNNFLNQYFNFQIGGKQVTIPYWCNHLSRGIFGPYGGKGTPRQILETTSEEAGKADFNLEESSSKEIYQFMKSKKIGLDCSGFVYQVLNFIDLQKGNDGIENNVGVISRTNARTLTSDNNTIPVDHIESVQVGDIIRLMGGGHVAVVIGYDKEKLTYAHISKKTAIEGPHLGEIEIVNASEDLKNQHWKELTRNQNNYGQSYFFPRDGDGLRRLRVWTS